MEDEVWTTTKGEKILVADMNEAHVRNALRKMIRTYLKPVETDKTDEIDDPVVYPPNTDNCGSLN